MAWKLKVVNKSDVDKSGYFEVTGDILDKENGVVISTYPNFTFRVNTKQQIVDSATAIVNQLKESRKESNKVTNGEEIDL